MTNRRRLILLSTASLALIVVILSDVTPSLRGPAPGTSDWYWPYSPAAASRWWAPLSVASALLLFIWWWFRRPRTAVWPTRFGLSGLVVGSLLMQFTLIYVDRPHIVAELIDRTLALNSNGYFRTAAEIRDMPALLRDYPERMPLFDAEHPRTHPPGLVLLNWMTIKAFDYYPRLADALAPPVWRQRCTDLWLLNQNASVAAALGVWALLPPLAAAFTVLPAYWLAVHLADRKKARLAAVFVATLPAMLLFAPVPDQLFGFLSVTMFLFIQIGLSRRRVYPFFLAGLAFSAATFLSLGNGILLLAIVILMAIAARYAATSPTPRLLQWSAAFAAGGFSIWILYWLAWDVPPWQLAQVGVFQHYQLVTSKRPYGRWLLYNLVDLTLYAGLPLLVIVFTSAVAAGKKVIRLRAGNPDAWSLALTLFVILLNLSGTSRGEVGRLWLFFMPLLGVIAGIQLASRWPARKQLIWLVGLQLLLAISLAIAWQHVEPVIAVAKRPPQPADPQPTNMHNVRLGDRITLLGYDLENEPSRQHGGLRLTLYWQADGPTLRPYTVFTHLVSAGGTILAQKDNMPVGGVWPPTCWQEGEIVVDAYTVEFPSDVPTGKLRLLVGMYDASTGVRLLTKDGVDAITIASIPVE